MPTFGAITQSQTYRLELNSTSTSTVKGSVTVLNIRRDRISEVEAMSAVVGAHDRQVSSGVARVIFMVNPAPNSGLLFKLSQGPLVVEETVSIDTQFVFEIV